jgi:hypothetical protein
VEFRPTYSGVKRLLIAQQLTELVRLLLQLALDRITDIAH